MTWSKAAGLAFKNSSSSTLHKHTHRVWNRHRGREGCNLMELREGKAEGQGGRSTGDGGERPPLLTAQAKTYMCHV